MAYTWLQFKNLVKSLASDGALNDTAGVLAVTHFVKSGITLQVDKNPALAAAHNQLWEAAKNKLLGYTITLNSSALRAAVDKLLTVDADRAGIAESGSFIDTLIGQATNEISGQATWYDNQIRQAVIELQEYIEFYRHGHETIYTFDDVTEDGEASVGELPEECRPQDAYYVKVGEQCVRMPIGQYDWQNRHDLVCGSPKLSGSEFLMALDPLGGTFIAFPKILEGHYISLNWDGNKLEFTDGENTPFDEALAEAVAQFLLWKMYMRATSLNLKLATGYRATYEVKRRHCFLAAKEKTELRYRNASPQPIPANAPCGSSCAVDVEDDNLVEFVFFGDSGDPANLEDTEAVANLIKSLEPDFIIHGGDTNYPDADPVTFQDRFLKYYNGWIQNEDWYQAWGNHDLHSLVEGGTMWGEPLLNILPHIADLNDGKLYYTFRRGGLNFFVYNSGFTDAEPREPDGIAVGSTQADWLLEALGEAEDGVNIVIMHKPPYTSDENYTPTGSEAMLELAAELKDAGAHLVLAAHGHNYERILVNGLPFIVCGLGGATKREFGAIVSGSQFRYTEKYGCLKVSGTEDYVRLAFYNTDKQLIDSLTIEVE